MRHHERKASNFTHSPHRSDPYFGKHPWCGAVQRKPRRSLSRNSSKSLHATRRVSATPSWAQCRQYGATLTRALDRRAPP